MQMYANDDGVVMTTPLGDTRLMPPVDDFRKLLKILKLQRCGREGGEGGKYVPCSRY